VLTGAQYDEVQAALAAARQAAETHRAELVRAGAGRHAGAGAGVSAADGEASGGARARRRTLRWR
jgi:hypothetical protein